MFEQFGIPTNTQFYNTQNTLHVHVYADLDLFIVLQDSNCKCIQGYCHPLYFLPFNSWKLFHSVLNLPRNGGFVLSMTEKEEKSPSFKFTHQ